MHTEQVKLFGKHLALIFEDGWAGASFKGAVKDESKIFAKVPLDDDFYVLYYKDIAVSLAYDLKLKECGLHKAWVIMAKAN